MVLVGKSMSDIDSLTGEGSWDKKTNAEKSKFVFTMVLMAITVGIMIYFIVYTCKIFRKIRAQVKKSKEAQKNQEEEPIVQDDDLRDEEQPKSRD